VLENCCRNPRRRRKIFRSSADGVRVEEQGEDVAGEWVNVCGKALLAPENSRLMREAEKRTKIEGQRGGKTCREKKKKQWCPGVPPNPRQSAKRGG
jgi:hypothetical protein